MAKAPRSKTGAKKRNDEHAALTLLDAAFCVDANRRRELVSKALANDSSLRRSAERWASRFADTEGATFESRVADGLNAFLASLGDVPLDAAATAGEPTLDAQWRARLASVGERLLQCDAIGQRFDDEFAVAKIDALKEFAYGAGHEINNPLANISLRAQTLLRDEANGERRRMLATINRQAMRAHEMIADLMLFARPPQLERTEVDAAAVVRRVVDELSATAQAQATRVECIAAETPLVARVDATQLAVAVKSIVRNAVEAVAAGGNVTVDARLVSFDEAARHRDLSTADASNTFRRRVGAAASQATAVASGDASSSVLEISVSDDGPGFSAREQAHLFDPFFSGREAGRGLGFGLCVAARIVADHGGQIAVMSETGRGATVVVTIPASTAVER